jgi:hypothetical protein
MENSPVEMVQQNEHNNMIKIKEYFTQKNCILNRLAGLHTEPWIFIGFHLFSRQHSAGPQQ